MASDEVWQKLRQEAEVTKAEEPALVSLVSECILDCQSLEEALSVRLASKLGNHAVPLISLQPLFHETLAAESRIGQQIRRDINAIFERDAACSQRLFPFLYFKGFHALSSYRIAHALWQQRRKALALYLQSLISETFAVDIHPAAQIGSGVLIDHATSVVIGETTVVEDDVSILHEVTLGGTGNEQGDRHPKIRSGVLIGAGAKILGNIEIGEGAKIGAGSVVLSNVPAHMTSIGVPAKVLCCVVEAKPALNMKHNLGS